MLRIFAIALVLVPLWVFRRFPDLLFLSFFVVNRAQIENTDPVSFQRLGSFWIALSLCLLAFHLALYGKLLSWLENSARMRRAMEAEAKRRGEDLPKIDVQARIENAGAFTKAIEFMIVIAGTLQWGYGDLFHCWMNGNGWRVCY